MASFAVVGKAVAMMDVTFWPLNAVPKSSVKTPLRYSRYCIQKGLSRLYWARICAAAASERPRSPPSAATGSPGIR